MKVCITCGMPFTGNHVNDIGLELPEGPVCKFDSADGKVKSGSEIFDGGVAFFKDEAADEDQELAERITRKNMKAKPYWKAHPFPELDGPEATEEEFQIAMSRIMK
jgi:hypothetical protein